MLNILDTAPDDKAVGAVLTHLNHLFGPNPPGELVLVTKKGDSVQHYPFHAADERIAAAQWAVLQSKDLNAYFAWATHDPEKTKGTRRVESAVAVPGFALDVDLAHGEHSAKNYPKDEAEALALIREAGLPACTGGIRSGGGLYLQWLFKKPFIISSESDRARIGAAWAAFEAKAREPFERAKLKLDNVSDLARMFRVPGLLNNKYEGALVTEAEWNDTVRYSLEELERIAPVAPTATKQAASVGGVRQLLAAERKKAYAATAELPELDQVLMGCAFIRHADADAATLTEPEWTAAASVVVPCKDGDRLFHEMSKPYPKYDPAETDAKIRRAKEGPGPATCRHIEDNLEFEGCKRCPSKGTISSPLQFGRERHAIVKAQVPVVFDLETGRYFDHTTGDLIAARAYGDQVRAKLGPNPHDKLLASTTLGRVRRSDYRPGEHRLIITEDDGTLSVNTWVAAGVEPKTGDPSLILEHFDYLLPDPVTREHVLDYLAHLYRYPEKKINHVIVLTGREGRGKSIIHLLLVALFGDKNAQKIEGEQLSSKFKGDLINKQVIWAEEANHGDRYEVAEGLKEWITAEKMKVQEKGIPFHKGRTPRGIFIFSNHDAPLIIQKDSRRYFIGATVKQAAEYAQFRRLDEGLDEAIPAFAAFLQARDVSNFNPYARPPMTAARERAEQASRTPLAQLIGELVDAGEGKFGLDVLQMDDILYAVKGSKYDVGTVGVEKLANAVKSVGGFKYPGNSDGKVRVKGKPTVLWAIRNFDRWEAAKATEWSAEYSPPPMPGGVYPFRSPEDPINCAIQQAVAAAGQ